MRRPRPAGLTITPLSFATSMAESERRFLCPGRRSGPFESPFRVHRVSTNGPNSDVSGQQRSTCRFAKHQFKYHFSTADNTARTPWAELVIMRWRVRSSHPAPSQRPFQIRSLDISRDVRDGQAPVTVQPLVVMWGPRLRHQFDESSRSAVSRSARGIGCPRTSPNSRQW